MKKAGWQAANWYHWRLFDLVERGTWDLVSQGHEHTKLLRELDHEYPPRKSTASPAPRTGGNGNCPLHPGKGHSAAECRALAAKAKHSSSEGKSAESK